MTYESDLKIAYDAWQAAKKTGDHASALAAGSAYEQLAEEAAEESCIYRGEVYPEHDYGKYECRRCGAEAPYEHDPDLPGDADA